MLRTVMVGLYVRGARSVLAAALFHALINVSWQLFPVHGSAYDPGLFAAVALVLAGCAGIALRQGSRGASPCP